MARIAAIDLFCGVGGLSFGLQQAGISVVAGVDVDAECDYPFRTNLDATFLQQDVRELRAAHLNAFWNSQEQSVRLLAGCAPCQPFSPYRRGQDTSDEGQWPLLQDFGRLVRETMPELV